MSNAWKDTMALETAKALLAADPAILDDSEEEQTDKVSKFLDLYETAWHHLDEMSVPSSGDQGES